MENGQVQIIIGWIFFIAACIFIGISMENPTPTVETIGILSLVGTLIMCIWGCSKSGSSRGGYVRYR